MSAPQTVGTPAGAQSAPAAQGISADSHGLDAILDGDLSGDDGSTAGDDILDAISGNAPADAPEAEPSEQEPPNKAQRLDDEVIYSDEALATPEGLLKAKARTLELRKMAHQKYLELKQFEKRVVKRHGKLQHQVQQYVAEKRNNELLLGNVRSNLQGLHSNDPDSILTALGNLTGTDGIKAYELLTSRIMNRGRPALDPQLQSLLDQQQQQIEQLKQERASEREQGKVQELTGRIGQHRQAIAQQVMNSTTTPHLTRVFGDDPQRLTDFIVKSIEESNGSIPAAQLYASMEQELRTHFQSAAPQGDSGGPAPKQPQQAQRSPGQSVGPSRAASSNPRTPTEDESLRMLADDKDLMSAFGF